MSHHSKRPVLSPCCLRVRSQVLFDYSKDQSTECEWCVYTQRAQGVKWQLLDKFLSSDWWLKHRRVTGCVGLA